MDGTGTLLDFGDDPSSPQSTPLVPSGGATLDPTPNHANGDPFDPFGDALFGGPEVMKTNDVTQTSQGFAFADDTDLFDPFASPKMSVETVTTNGTTSDVTQDQQQNYEAQFADLLGDLGDGSTAIQNGDINGTVTTVTKTTTEVSGGGDVITNSTVTVETDSDGGQVQSQQSRSPYDALQISTDDNRLSCASYSLSPPPSELNVSMTENMDDILGDFPENVAPRAEMEGDTDEDCRMSPGGTNSPDIMSRDFGLSIQSEVEFEQPVANQDGDQASDQVDHEDISDDYDDRAAELPLVASDDEVESPAPDRVINQNKMLASELMENQDHIYENLSGNRDDRGQTLYQGQGHSSDSLAEDADLADYTVVEKVPEDDYQSPDEGQQTNIATVPVSKSPEGVTVTSSEGQHYKDAGYIYRPADRVVSTGFP